MTPKLFLFSLLLSTGISTPLTKLVNPNSLSSFDVKTSNVAYDLRVMYGDVNHDGRVSEGEYKSFDFTSLEPFSYIGENPDFRFLGIYPGDDYFIFYTYSKERLDTSKISDQGYYVYDSINNYSLTYKNSITLDYDSDTGYKNDKELSCTPTFVNFYKGIDGYFSKFIVENYSKKVDEDFQRVKAVHFTAWNDNETILSADCGEGGELIFNSDDFRYYEENVYQIEARMDLLLATTHQETTTRRIGYLPIDTNSKVTSAKEIFYVFFDFLDKSFHPENLSSVTCTGLINTYQHTSYYVKGGTPSTDYKTSGMDGIYPGKFTDEQESLVVKGTSAYPSRYGVEEGQVLQNEVSKGDYKYFLKTTYKGVMEVEQIDSSDVLWRHHDIKRTYKCPNLIVKDRFEEDFASDDFKMFRDWYHDENAKRDTYSYGYSISDDAWIRKVFSDQQIGFIGSTYDIISFQKRMCNCHELSGVITLGMEVVEQGKQFSIKTFHDPLTVRYVSVIGLEPPTLGDFILNDIASWWNEIQAWMLPLLIAGLIILLVILSLAFPAALKAIKKIIKGLITFVKFLINLVYWILIWWWLALIKKAAKKPLPKKNLFRK